MRTVADDWKTSYKRAVLTAFARQADVRLDRDNYYASGSGFNHGATGKVRQHLKTCTIDPVLTKMPTDSEWDEFMGTFYEGDTTKHGMDATVTCRCGYVRKTRMRLEGTFSNLLRAVLEED